MPSPKYLLLLSSPPMQITHSQLKQLPHHHFFDMQNTLQIALVPPNAFQDENILYPMMFYIFENLLSNSHLWVSLPLLCYNSLIISGLIQLFRAHSNQDNDIQGVILPIMHRGGISNIGRLLRELRGDS